MYPTNSGNAASQPPDSSKPRDAFQPTMTSMIQRELLDFEQQTPRRARIIGRLIFLQAALLVMIAPLSFWPSFDAGATATVVVGLLFYCVAWLQNVTSHTHRAQLVLLIGSALTTGAMMGNQFYIHSGQILPVGLASLPFLLTIIIAGLLFLPEAVLIVTGVTTIFTAIVLFASLALGPGFPESQTYLLAVLTLGLQALVGIMSWQLSHFILDSSAELARTRQDEFIGTQYEALRRSIDVQASQLREQVVALVSTLLDLSRGDYTARPNVVDGELKPIADAINILISQISRRAESEQMQNNVLDDAMLIAGLAGEIGEGDLSSSSPTNALPTTVSRSMMQTAMVALQRARAGLARRLTQVRDLSIDAGQRLSQIENKTQSSEQVVAENLATIGLLRAEADRVYGSATQLSQLVDIALTILAPLLPPEVSAQPRMGNHEPHATVELQQLMPGVTIPIDTITDETQLPSHEATPFAVPNIGGSEISAENQARLREMWSKLIEMTEEVAKEVRDALVLQEKLGITSRSIRQLDYDLREVRLTVNDVRQIAEQLYRIAGSSTQPLTGQGNDAVAQSLSRPVSQFFPQQGGGQPVPPQHLSQPMPQHTSRPMSRPIPPPSQPLSQPIIPGAGPQHPSQPMQHTSRPMSRPMPSPQQHPSQPMPPPTGGLHPTQPMQQHTSRPMARPIPPYQQHPSQPIPPSYPPRVNQPPPRPDVTPLSTPTTPEESPTDSHSPLNSADH
jgi:hypothetical protein